MYTSAYEAPTTTAAHVLYGGRILDSEEQPHEMVERVVNTLAEQEMKLGGIADEFAHQLGSLMDEGKVVMSTPIMTNAGRFTERPLSACTMPTIDISANRELIAKELSVLHQQGMGTGFNLSELKDPVSMLTYLNDRAVEGAASGKEERPVGNMAILRVSHPRIYDFIQAKVDAPKGDQAWKFNISVDISNEFMDAVAHDGSFVLDDGTVVRATALFDVICESAQQCADPGLIFMDRMNDRNPVPMLGEYKTTAPCAEVGLVPGESCQFGYVNVGKFVSLDDSGQVTIDYDGLYRTAGVMTRALDNALEVSIANYATYQSVHVMSNKRKIGVGVCGVADAISMAGLSYDSPAARKMMLDVLALINYGSKEASIQLAEERGSCGAMLGSIGNRYYDERGYIERLYGTLDTASVNGKQWIDLSRRISTTGNLRNVSTVALPPTGRSALVVDASTGIEAHFSISGVSERVRRALLVHAGLQLEDRPLHPTAADLSTLAEHPETSALLADATRISARGHLAMAATLQRATDESISKTVNLPEGATAGDVEAIYREAHEAGMSGITVYVDGTFGRMQPKRLDK